MVVETLDVAKKSAGVMKMARNIFIYVALETPVDINSQLGSCHYRVERT
jgi:hypothetical protein